MRRSYFCWGTVIFSNRVYQTVGTVPPSITYSLPLIENALSETRNAISSATSSGRPGRPIGIPPRDFINSWRAVCISVPDCLDKRSMRASAAEVSMKPGGN